MTPEETWKENTEAKLIRLLHAKDAGLDGAVEIEKIITFLGTFYRSRELVLFRELEEKIEGMKRDEKYGMDVGAFQGTIAARSFNSAYNTALSDITALLKESARL